MSALVVGSRVYLATRFERQAEARALAAELVRAGFFVTSRWLTAPGLALTDATTAARQAREDLEDLDAADVCILVLFSPADAVGRGGKDFEAGYAYARGRQVVVVGAPAHVFHYLPDVQRLPDVATLRFLYLDGEKIDDMPPPAPGVDTTGCALFSGPRPSALLIGPRLDNEPL